MTSIIRRAALAAAAVALSALSVTSLGAAPASAAQVSENDYFKSIDVILSVDEVQQAAVSVPAADGVCRAEVMPDAIAINPSWIDVHAVRHPAELLVREVPGRRQQGDDPLLPVPDDRLHLVGHQAIARDVS